MGDDSARIWWWKLVRDQWAAIGFFVFILSCFGVKISPVTFVMAVGITAVALTLTVTRWVQRKYQQRATTEFDRQFAVLDAQFQADMREIEQRETERQQREAELQELRRQLEVHKAAAALMHDPTRRRHRDLR